MKVNIFRKITSFILVFFLCLQVLPVHAVYVHAEENNDQTNDEQVLNIDSSSAASQQIDTEEETVITDDISDDESDYTVSGYNVNSANLTVDEEVATVADEGEIGSVIGSSEVWNIIQANGGLLSPYAFKDGIMYGEYNSIDLLKQWLNSYHTSSAPITWTDNKLISMPLDNGKQLILLSITDPSVYQSTSFTAGSVTGSIDLTDQIESTISFQGLGSSTYPFNGTFVNSGFTINRTLFNNLEYADTCFNDKQLTIDWKGEINAGAMVASSIHCAALSDLTVLLTRTEKEKYNYRGAVFGEITGNLNLSVSFDRNTANNDTLINKVSENQNNAGVIANTLTSGTLNLTVTNFPNNIEIGIDGLDDAEKSNAGLLIGYMNDASLNLNGFPDISFTATVQSAKGSAGGLVGRIDVLNNLASGLKVSTDINLSKTTVLGKYTGGIAGYAKDITVQFLDDKCVSLPENLGVKANNIVNNGYVTSICTGGIFGWYCINQASSFSSFDGKGFTYPASITTSADSSSGVTGAVFGKLELNGNTSFSIKGTEERRLGIVSSVTVTDDANITSSGGLIGTVTAESLSNQLSVEYVDVKLTGQSTNRINYLGGIIGTVNNASVTINNVKETVPQPTAKSYFGGLAGKLDQFSIMQVASQIEIATTETTSPAAITKGGGLVGEMTSKTVLSITGTTDLSKVKYQSSKDVGQIVGKQEKSLVFAYGNGNGTNWTYQRSSEQSRVDDIGNYGQVIRLGDKLSSDLITIVENNVTFKAHGDYGTISTADDFALHAIAFQTENVFEIYSNGSSLYKTDISIQNDIDLTGTGIQGFTRDNGSSWKFSGETNGTGVGVSCDGNGSTVTINTGEVYGLRNGIAAKENGSGQCYYHGYYGLFGYANSAKVINLKIKGVMNIGADVATYAGFVFGYISGGNEDATIRNTIKDVTISEESVINIDGPGVSNPTFEVNIGGMIGYITGEKTHVYVADSASNATINYSGMYEKTVIGGIIGSVKYKESDLKIDNVSVSGSISAGNIANNAHIGGLIADFVPDNVSYPAKLSLKNIVISANLSSNARKSAGGLLGYYWNNVDVLFVGAGEAYAVSTNGSSLTYSGNASTGGLCYAATGRWRMNGIAVDMGESTISNGTGALGLLVCHGESQGTEAGTYSNAGNALYLVMDTNWKTAYLNSQVTINNGSHAVFDEIVAYTAANNDIMNNNAGIISLKTETEKVDFSSSARNTYENRTAYGMNNKTNSNSRYYYNLNVMNSFEGNVDTPEEFLIWSVSKYCSSNILSYLPAINSNTITGILDMDGYSYYPISIENQDVSMENAVITFWNKDIEDKENGNKSTLSTNGRTQHFAMHSGVFYNYVTDLNSTQASNLTISNLTLIGTVGMVDNGSGALSSGALICGTVQGYNGTNHTKITINTLKADNDTKHLSVSAFNTDYAPLMINNVYSYSTLNITGVTVDDGDASATSLMGRVGNQNDTNTQGINISFSEMKLADTVGRFTKSTFLHSLYYVNQNNSVVYNFAKDEDWVDSTHLHNVTYGKEIGGTSEYAEYGNNPHQHHYAQSVENVSYTGNKFTGEDRDDFSSYLPYVCVSFNSATNYHEILVNSSLTDILLGCGTYGDPYQINSSSELQSIAIFLSTGIASKEWTINLSGNDGQGNAAFCTGGSHITYVYNGAEWKSTDGNNTVSTVTVRTYLLNAYYQIKADIHLSNFPGIGNRANPFRGVIIGENGKTITLEDTLPKGFIVCSYGSVVKDLNIRVEGTIDVSFTEIQNNSGYTSESYFGAVIGCILGGDNIIDNVNVNYGVNSSVTLGGDKPHLITVGGYIGVISGGGVIFRSSNVLTGQVNSKVEDVKYFYVNKYVGRVIQGFAVQEGNGVKLDNSNKNYQICKLDSSAIDGISVSNNQVSINGAQALLVFSSITNSGGAGGGALLPYYTNARSYWNNGAFSATYVGGKVRNASYTKVGNVAEAKDLEYQQSLKDDFAGFGEDNSSYLDTHYAGGKLYNICENTGLNITLSSKTYDMTFYGNGYRSISPRYLANALCNDLTNSKATTNYKLLNPLISSFQGDEAGSRIDTDIIVKEYVDDDHHAIAVGGVINTLRSSTSTTVSNISIGGIDSSNRSNIQHEYYEWSGTKLDDATHKNWTSSTQGFTNLNYAQGRGLVAVGGVVGNSVAEIDTNITFANIKINNVEMKGPFDAGGIIGHTGLLVNSGQANSFSDNKNYHICYLIGQNKKYIVPSFTNCSYSNLDLFGGWMVGGYIGLASYDRYAPDAGRSSIDKEIVIVTDNTILGKDSQIVCKRAKSDNGIDVDREPVSGSTSVCKVLSASGGLIGTTRCKVKIDNSIQSKIENVEIRSTRSAGGIVAWAYNQVTINNVFIIGYSEHKNQIGDLPEWNGLTGSGNEPATICEFAGGLVGYYEASGVLSITNCKVQNVKIVASLRNSYPCYAGGMVGNLNTSGNHIIADSEVNGISLSNTKYSNSTKLFYGGGLIGGLQTGNIYSSNVLINNISNNNDSSNSRIGNLMSIYDGKTDNIVYMAGISIQNTQISSDIGGKKTTKCYIAYTDYNGNASTDDKDGSVILNSKAPHVTTSPRGVSIPVSAADAEGNKEQFYLYGDGANPSIVQQIYDDRQQTINGKYTYSQTSDCTFDTRYNSTFYAEMGLTEETANGIPDFPVLQVTVANKTTVSKQIVDYLDLVTNKGFSTARDTSVNAGGHISYSIDLYKWNEEDKYFVKNPAGVTKAFSGSGDNYETSFLNYDTGKNQFELLTVTFTEQEYKYTVLVPVVVRRMLEIDFSATLKDSPSFQMSEYEVYNSEGYKPNITVGYGTSVSALLTYTYNRAIGENQDYDWNFHIENGGFMGDPEQTIQFYNPQSKLKSLPSGTQLVLLDCFNNNKAYSYKVKTQSENEGTKIKFSDFKDSSGNSYSKWLSEIVDVKATSDPTGKWIKVNENEATVRIKEDGQYLYFRQKTSSETVDSNSLFSLSVVNAQPVEQFYLVIYIPDSSVAGIPVTNEIEGKNLNGYISSVFTGLSGKVECNVNPIRTKKDGIIVSDPQSSSECTYNFLSGYSQNLTDNSSDKSLKLDTDPEAYVLLNNPESDGNYLLHMDMEDEITVVKGQKDTATTELYYKESVSLAKYEKQANGSVTLASANGFPTGCFGTVEFFVYTKDESGNIDNNYKWDGNNWIGTNVDDVGLSYEWTSNGQNMELYLGTDNSKDGAVNLSAIRELAKSGNEKFYIRTKVDIHMSVPAAEQAIAGSITKGNSYTKLSYTSFLATNSEAFSSTNYVESAMGEVRYYQSRSGNSTISHSANDSTQLGINCSDLTSANGVIYTTGVYDLTTVSNAESLIQDANKVIYTLTLWQRQEDGGYQQVTEDLGKYISDIRIKDKTVSYADGYHWTDVKEGGSFSSIDPENGKRFLIPIRIQVNTDVEANGVTFANYQLRLTATLYNDEDILDQPVNSETTINGITVYTRYDYVTYTITRLLTNGYWGE